MANVVNFQLTGGRVRRGSSVSNGGRTDNSPTGMKPITAGRRRSGVASPALSRMALANAANGTPHAGRRKGGARYRGGHTPHNGDSHTLPRASSSFGSLRTASQQRLRTALADVGQSLKDLRSMNRLEYTASLGSHAEGSREGSDSGSTETTPPEPLLPRRGTFWQKVFMVLDNPSSCRLGRYTSMAVLATISVAAISFVVESLPRYRIPVDMGADPQPAFVWIEIITIALFTLEYMGRALTAWAVPAVYLDPGKRLGVWERNFVTALQANDGEEFDEFDAAMGRMPGATLVPAARTPGGTALSPLQLEHATTGWKKTWLFVKSPANLLDLAAILPFYLELLFSSIVPGLAVMRTLRLTRVFRVFKIGKYSSSVRLLSRVIHTSMEALYLMLFFVMLGMVVFGTVIFYCEAGTLDPQTGLYMRPDISGHGEEISPFTSIVQSFYWVVITATTVGYGDLTPTTVAGKVTATVLTHFGILALALPITVIGANFAVEYSMDEPEEDGQWLEAALEAIEQDRLSRSGSVNAVVDVTSAAHLSTDITNPTARRHDTASKLAGTSMGGVPAAKQAPAAGATEQKQAFSSRIARPSGLTSIDTTLPGPPAGSMRSEAALLASAATRVAVSDNKPLPAVSAELAKEMKALAQECSQMQAKASEMALRLEALTARMRSRTSPAAAIPEPIVVKSGSHRRFSGSVPRTEEPQSAPGPKPTFAVRKGSLSAVLK